MRPHRGPAVARPTYAFPARRPLLPVRLCLDCCKVSPRTASLVPLLERWRTDPLGSYQSWFLWDQRLKNFRTIRRGVSKVVEEIEAGTFGSLYRGSSLEIVVRSIAEQRQVFKGADHAFLWKPKLRIPDIYENKDNQKAFGRFLATCACCDEADQVVDAVHALDAHEIKGLGPAVANLMYFLHPTLVPPSNTAIVRGYNALTGAKIKLGSWKDYLAMRLGVLRLNLEHGDLLSNDLGAIAGLLFDVGSERYLAPPLVEDEALRTAWEVDLARVREASAAERKASRLARESDKSHTEIQAWLRDLGHALGFNVWIAANDRSRLFHDQALGAGCLLELPRDLSEHPAADMVRLIDVLWLEKDKSTVAAAFEVEHTTSIYSGIVRLLDLALGAPRDTASVLYIVAPDDREEEVRGQLRRPAFSRVTAQQVKYLAYGELGRHRDAIARFGHGLKGIEAIARVLD